MAVDRGRLAGAPPRTCTSASSLGGFGAVAAAGGAAAAAVDVDRDGDGARAWALVHLVVRSPPVVLSPRVPLEVPVARFGSDAGRLARKKSHATMSTPMATPSDASHGAQQPNGMRALHRAARTEPASFKGGLVSTSEAPLVLVAVVLPVTFRGLPSNEGG